MTPVLRPSFCLHISSFGVCYTRPSTSRAIKGHLYSCVSGATLPTQFCQISRHPEQLSRFATKTATHLRTHSYRQLANLLDEVKVCVGPGSRSCKLDMLQKYFEALISDPAQLKLALKLILGQLRPQGSGVKLMVAEACVREAVRKLDSGGPDAMVAQMQRGDAEDLAAAVGNVIEQLQLPHQASVSLGKMIAEIDAIGKIAGKGSVEKRAQHVADILVQLTKSEAVYFVRTLLGKGPRVGALECVVFNALAQAMPVGAFGLEAGEDMVFEIKSRFALNPDVDLLVDDLQPHRGAATILRSQVARFGTPFRPMLSTPERSVESVWRKITKSARLGPWTAEWKYDGERLQIHADKDGVKIFSRSLKNVTDKYPDVCKRVRSRLRPHVSSVVLDAEVVAVVSTEGCVKQLPFQVLSKRKAQVFDEDNIAVQVATYVFDCLLHDGKPIMEETLMLRRQILLDSLDLSDHHFRLVEHMTLSSEHDLKAALAASQADGTEGLVVKNLNAAYKPDTRNGNWLKLKKDYLNSSLSDSVDAIVVGVWFGMGRYAGLFTSFLLAVRAPHLSQHKLQTITRVGTGLSDTHIRSFTKAYQHRTTDARPTDVHIRGDLPDKWIVVEHRPVWEVLGADFTKSPTHTCAMGLRSDLRDGGISLRFPRVLRMDRDDKDVSSASAVYDVLHLYDSQVKQVETNSISSGGLARCVKVYS